MSNNNDDAIAALAGAGIIVLTGYGIYKFLQQFGEYERGETITRKEAVTLSTYAYSSRHHKFCPHNDPVLCSSCRDCIECSGGEGDLSDPSEPLCYSCGYYDSGDDD
jgi:hypothetical protein